MEVTGELLVIRLITIQKNLDGIYFALGIGDSCKKKDCYGNDFLISESEWKTLPKLSPKGGFDIKKTA